MKTDDQRCSINAGLKGHLTERRQAYLVGRAPREDLAARLSVVTNASSSLRRTSSDLGREDARFSAIFGGCGPRA